MIENIFRKRKRGGRGGRGDGPGPKVAAGWSSSTNCSPAASASTGENLAFQLIFKTSIKDTRFRRQYDEV